MATIADTTSPQKNIFDAKVLGHPAGLFFLFFTEMWERFSFYGMRVLLVNFLTMAAIGSNPGWEWSSSNAGALYGTYAGLVFLTPILGGYIADKKLGHRFTIILGCLVMTAGHASMAFDTEFSLYLGLGLLVIGTGLFKPNINSILSKMYKYLPEKKDSAYTIFYMGINSGAFFGMMLCGYLAERVGWSWGFGLAGVFMLFGTLQFILSKRLFENIEDKPQKTDTATADTPLNKGRKANKFTVIDLVLIAVTSIIGLFYLLDDPISKISDFRLLPKAFILPEEVLSGSVVITIIGLLLFLYLIFSRIFRYDKIVRDRMIVVVIFAFFITLFHIPSEQAATSMVLFARDYTTRILTGNHALLFNIANTLLTVIPLLIISWVLVLLARKTFKTIPGSSIVLSICFFFMWGIALWMLFQDFSSTSYDVSYKAVATEQIKDGRKEIVYEPITRARPLQRDETAVMHTLNITTTKDLEIGERVAVHEELNKFQYLTPEDNLELEYEYEKALLDSRIIHGKITDIKESEVEITVSWFSILNSFFIIAFASFFSKWWESKYNPPAAVKFGLGLVILGIAFLVLTYGAGLIPQGTPAGAVRVSMFWLIATYFLITMGELCISPLGLSYVSKLVPGRMIALMFGMWYLALSIGNKLAASFGGMLDSYQEEHSLSDFFFILAIIGIGAGIVAILLHPLIKKLMHGVK